MTLFVSLQFDDLITLGIDDPRVFSNWFIDHYPDYDLLHPLSEFTDYLISNL